MIYKAGESVDVPSSWSAVALDNVTEGDYIFKYGSPSFVYGMIPPGVIQGVIEKWVALKNETGATIVEIKGISINTDTGEILIKEHITPPAPQTITIGGKEYPAESKEAGINPLAVVAITTAVIGALIGGIWLLSVYGESALTPGQDPCASKGVVNYFTCLVRRSAWVGIGIAIGGLLALVFVIIALGKSPARA